MTLLPQSEFTALLAASLQDGSLVKLTLGKPRGTDATLRNIFVRPVLIGGQPQLSLVWHHDRRDITKNHPPDAALALIGLWLGTDFYSAHLFTTARLVQLEFNKKGEPHLTFGKATGATPDLAHDRAKPRLLTGQSHDWLEALGVITATGVVRESMADKHRQIHKFVEILSHLVPGASFPTDRPLEVADMGCGKGYLTFATHDYFDHVAKLSARICGIEVRRDLVEAGNRIAHDTGRTKLSFLPGSIDDVALPHLDVLIALHACDTATDDAIARGVKHEAALIVVAPCCQKELRPQLRAAPVLAPALRHGIFQERHAEFATDALRALLLEWAGYDTKVFEFIANEHTAKNLMITATKHGGLARSDEAADRVRALASFYGIKTQSLARQLGFELSA